MGQALYRKYRSKALGEIVGQEHITNTLSQAVKGGHISHAYLFTGPRGVGKTSIARILAHEINGLPYVQEDNHLDIIEIDAASNRGIDEIRDLREKVYMAPVEGKYKVYIIDEVHMLTTQAFNALLKTLEEPPAHAVFILATTEAHKLPETIISRTQRYIFKPVEAEQVIAHLKSIAKTEKIQIDDDALALFAAHGGGSFRDSISLLDQAGSSGSKVTRETAEQMLGIPPEQAIQTLLDLVVAGQPAGTLQQVEQLQANGYQPAAIAKQLGAQLRDAFVAQQPQLGPAMQLQLMRDLLDVAPAHEPGRILELALLRTVSVGAMTVPTAAPAPVTTSSQPAAATKARTTAALPVQAKAAERTSPTLKEAVKPTPGLTPAPEPVRPENDSEPADRPTSTTTLDPAVWTDILGALKSKYNTLYGVMRMAVPEFSEGTMTLRFRFAFHQKRMNEAKHRKIVGDIIKELTGQQIVIQCLYDKNAELSESPLSTASQSVAAAVAVTDPADLAAISNIFGGGELVES